MTKMTPSWHHYFPHHTNWRTFEPLHGGSSVVIGANSGQTDHESVTLTTRFPRPLMVVCIHEVWRVECSSSVVLRSSSSLDRGSKLRGPSPIFLMVLRFNVNKSTNPSI
ncbi:hypothetical protein TNCV_216141 [Trichonephila clavipes]|nr:hypothetical protein TNCV_216141 [Trichonephila clavipes]